MKNWRPFFDWFSIGAVVASAIYLCEKVHMGFYPLALVIIGNRLFALALLGHEGVHGLLFRNSRINTSFARYLCHFPCLISHSKFKTQHLLHHRYLGTQMDPDILIYGQTTSPFSVWILKQIKDFLSLRTLRDFLFYYTEISHFFARGRKSSLVSSDLRAYLIFWLVVAIGLYRFHLGSFFLLYWFLPILCHLPVFLFSNLWQHKAVQGGLSRNLSGSFIARWFFGPLNLCYHEVHHRDVSLPHYRLREHVTHETHWRMAFQEIFWNQKKSIRSRVIFRDQVHEPGEWKKMVGILGSLILEKDSSEDPIVCRTNDKLLAALVWCSCRELGRSFVPLSPQWPSLWTEHALSLLGSCLVVQDASQSVHGDLANRVLIVETKKLCEDVPKAVLKRSKTKKTDFIYMMPTSGSTGVPKLVPVTLRSWQAFLKGARNFVVLNKFDRVAICFEPHFDPFVAMLELSFLAGADVVLLDDSEKFDALQFCRKNKISVWSSVPTLLKLNLQREKRVSGHLGLRLSILTGEKLQPSLVRQWRQWAPDSEILNLYGPVETTVWVAGHRVCEEDLLKDIPIGLAFEGSSFKIDDGELVVGGDQVAAGYLQKKEGENFLQEFNGVFRTGDRVELNSKKQFLFKGRGDTQVKLGGQRFELEALETSFSNLTGLNCVALLVSAGEISTLALVVKSEPPKEVWQDLKNLIPGALMPRDVYISEAWPLTSSGKTDRKEILQLLQSGKLVRLHDRAS